MTRQRGRKHARTAAGWVLLSTVAFAFALFMRAVAHKRNATVISDGQLGVRLFEVARTSFARGHGFPLWDRSQCAGMPFLGNPRAGLISSLVAGVFGIHGDEMARWYPTVGAAVGLVAMYAWCRHALSLGRIASLFAGGIFVTSGIFVLQTAVRNSWVAYSLIPFALLLARLGERDLRAAIGLGGVLALMSLEGGTYPLAMAIVALLVVEGPRIFVRGVGAARIASVGGIALLVFVLLAGIKLFPTIAQAIRFPRSFHESDKLALADFFPMLIDSDREAFPGHQYHWNEYRIFVGPLAAGMTIAGAGIAIILQPRRWGLFVLLLVGLLVTRGVYSATAPYVLIKHLPLFSQLRVPSRWAGLFVLALAATAGLTLHTALHAVKSNALRVVLVAIAVVAVYDPLVRARTMLEKLTVDPWLPRPDPMDRPFRLIAGDDFGRSAEYPARNVGAVACDKRWDFPTGTGYAVGDQTQASVDGVDGTVDGVDGTVDDVAVRQNDYTIRVTLRRPAAVNIQQNFDVDWRSDVGEVVRNASGRISVRLPAGKHTIVVAYRPRGLWSGAVASALGVVLSIAGFVYLSRRRRGAHA